MAATGTLPRPLRILKPAIDWPLGVLEDMGEQLSFFGRALAWVPRALPAYWKEIINFDALVRYGTISLEDLQLFKFADDPASALKILQEGIASGASEVAPDFAHSRC